jgi:hypothetical protein
MDLIGGQTVGIVIVIGVGIAGGVVVISIITITIKRPSISGRNLSVSIGFIIFLCHSLS